MAEFHGFELIREQEIAELNTYARLFRHIRTGAELLSLENDDENKVFGINFYTPPEDSTGLPHILEHAVLNGSRKYPVKEPFVELIKGSLQTFVNAFTWSDMTSYPVASTNTADFYNLVDVYLDAVFYPRLGEKILQQEGWHYELEGADAPLEYKGVVFNEMKGAYSSPEGLLGRYTEQYLLPDTPHVHDAGGDPAVIPNLTYEQFKTFHETYYHPSNARIVFYGDDDPMQRLKLVDEFIAEFGAIEAPRSPGTQPRFKEARSVTLPYSVAADDDDAKSMMTISWLLPETTDVEKHLAWVILSHILMDTPASPLRKALIDSGLGEDLVNSGLVPNQREMFLSAGLKGVASEDIPQVETLVLETLGNLADNGIDPNMVEAAMNTIEFLMRENNTGNFPRGIALMVNALPAWTHGGDPIDSIAFEQPLENIKAQIANSENGAFFEDMIGQYLLDNPHRSTIILQPDKALSEKQEEAERQRLDDVQARLGESDIQAILDDMAVLKEMQEAPDAPEDLAKIPHLTIDDLDKEHKPTPCEKLDYDGTTILYHDLFTNGITYLDVGLNLRALPSEYLNYVELFGRALLEMGTDTEDFVQLSQRIGQKTGGIDTQSFVSAVKNSDDTAAWLFLRGKATIAQTDDMLAILQDVLQTVNLDNRERFRQMVLEEKTNMEAMIVPAGHQVIFKRLRAHTDEAGWVNEQISGTDYLFFLRDLVVQIDDNWKNVLSHLQAIRGILVNRKNMIVNVTLDAENWQTVQPQVEGFLATLPVAESNLPPWEKKQYPQNEGLTIPAQVNYVGKGGNLYAFGYEHDGKHIPIVKNLYVTYMWEKIRVQGGAYGGMVTFDHPSGVFSYGSYRDPNLLGTLKSYDGTPSFLKKLKLSESDLTRAIIGGISQLDQYLLPDAKGFQSLMSYLIDYTDEKKQQVRDGVLSLQVSDFHEFGAYLEKLIDTSDIVVLGSKEDIEQANKERDNFLTVTQVL